MLQTVCQRFISIVNNCISKSWILGIFRMCLFPLLLSTISRNNVICLLSGPLSSFLQSINLDRSLVQCHPYRQLQNGYNSSCCFWFDVGTNVCIRQCSRYELKSTHVLVKLLLSSRRVILTISYVRQFTILKVTSWYGHAFRITGSLLGGIQQLLVVSPITWSLK